MAERSDKERTTINLTPIKGRIEQLRSDSAWKALSLSKKVMLLLEEYLELLEQEHLSTPTQKAGAAQSHTQINILDLQKLADQLEIPSDRLLQAIKEIKLEVINGGH